MEDKELRQAFEDVTTNNVKAVLAHSNETRKMVRELGEEVVRLGNLVRQYDERFNETTKQLAVLQTKIYSGGT